MNMTFRWYGEGFDPIPLQYVKQIPGMSGIMGVLSDKAAGEVWPKEEVAALVDQVHAAGLACEVIESVNVHEDIKMGLPTRDGYIRSYCTTLENLAEYGVKVVIYNFMPVFDWLRTELAHVDEDGATCLYYDHAEVEGMTPREIVERTARDSAGLTLPGWEPERLDHLDEVMERYQGITREQMRENYRSFLEGIIPTCEKMLTEAPVSSSVTTAPARPRGTVSMIVSGVRKLSNCAASTRKTMASDMAKTVAMPPAESR